MGRHDGRARAVVTFAHSRKFLEAAIHHIPIPLSPFLFPLSLPRLFIRACTKCRVEFPLKVVRGAQANDLDNRP
jgi:hypothetical protein